MTFALDPANRPLRHRFSRRRGLRLLMLTLLVPVAFGAACTRAPGPLEHTFGSVDDLARAVLDAVSKNDRDALRSMSLSEEEFRGRVWPELPASRPERNLPFDYVWGELDQKSRAYLGQTLNQHGGHRYDLVRVEFVGETTAYETFEVARDTRLAVRGRDGREQEIRLFGSTWRGDGRHKVFSYVVD